MPFQTDAIFMAVCATIMSALLMGGADGRVIGIAMFIFAVAYMGIAASVLLASKPPSHQAPKTDKKTPPDVS